MECCEVTSSGMMFMPSFMAICEMLLAGTDTRIQQHKPVFPYVATALFYRSTSGWIFMNYQTGYECGERWQRVPVNWG
jgi:hypothetical protein